MSPTVLKAVNQGAHIRLSQIAYDAFVVLRCSLMLRIYSEKTARVAVVQAVQEPDTSGDQKDEEEADVDDSEILEDWPNETEVTHMFQRPRIYYSLGLY